MRFHCSVDLTSFCMNGNGQSMWPTLVFGYIDQFHWDMTVWKMHAQTFVFRYENFFQNAKYPKKKAIIKTSMNAEIELWALFRNSRASMLMKFNNPYRRYERRWAFFIWMLRLNDRHWFIRRQTCVGYTYRVCISVSFIINVIAIVPRTVKWKEKWVRQSGATNREILNDLSIGMASGRRKHAHLTTNFQQQKKDVQADERFIHMEISLNLCITGSLAAIVSVHFCFFFVVKRMLEAFFIWLAECAWPLCHCNGADTNYNIVWNGGTSAVCCCRLIVFSFSFHFHSPFMANENINEFRRNATELSSIEMRRNWCGAMNTDWPFLMQCKQYFYRQLLSFAFSQFT